MWIKTEHSSWTKWQATLMLTIYANGIMQCLPILIFHGQHRCETAARQEERQQYHPGVRVCFNSTAYSNKAVTLEWVRTDLCYMTSPFDWLQPKHLVIWWSNYRSCPNLMKELHITPIYILDGCTGYVQSLDTILNKLLKDRIAADLDEGCYSKS